MIKLICIPFCRPNYSVPVLRHLSHIHATAAALHPTAIPGCAAHYFAHFAQSGTSSTRPTTDFNMNPIVIIVISPDT